MARDPEPAALDGGVPEAIVAMGLHMVESRVRLFGDLAKCGTPVEAGETITRWMSHRLEEFGADQARLMEAWLTSVARTAAIATETLAGGDGGTPKA
jgi:hypothetical protein